MNELTVLERGADGFLPKTAERSELAEAISTVLSGGGYLSPLIPKTTHRVGLAAIHPGLADLTPRQEDVVQRLGAGQRPGEIAKALGLSACTISGHLKLIRRKLGVASDGELVRLAVAFSLGEVQPAALLDSPPAGTPCWNAGAAPCPWCDINAGRLHR